jgi:lipoate-protein ligase A
MRVYRGRADTVEDDRAVTGRVFERVADQGEPAVRVWRPHRHVAFGRRDARTEGYERAREAARERGFPPVERRVGGRAVAYTGRTVAFTRVTPIEDPRGGLGSRYATATDDLRAALAELGVATTEGEPPDSFCPGTHSLRVGRDGGKVVGLAQRVRRRAAAVAGICLVADHEAVASVLEPIYAALDVPFDPDSVASVARAGSDVDPVTAMAAVESALVGDREATVERVGPGRPATVD